VYKRQRGLGDVYKRQGVAFFARMGRTFGRLRVLCHILIAVYIKICYSLAV
jgi:hypothetical protein